MLAAVQEGTVKKLRISPDLALPPDAVTQTIVVYGGKGMGKTNFGTVLCEELARSRLRFSVIDPMGVFHGLRHAADGKRPGIEVLILGGRHGDIPIEPTGGAVVADLVADEEVDVVIDISRRPDGTMWSLGERIRFVTDYCTRLYQRQGERARPLMQIIDEAGRYCPQVIPHGSPQLAACVGAIERMVEEGRNVGIGVTLITQRSARMNKSVSELAECMVSFRTVGPRSLDAILDWFGEHVPKARWNELGEKLRALPRGHALVVSPGWLAFEGVAAIRARETFDSSATPAAGRAPRASGPGAKPDLSKYRDRMSETIERSKANDPKELQREVARLRAELAKKPAAAPAKVERVEVRVVTEKVAERLENAALGASRAAEVLARHASGVIAELHAAQDELRRLRNVPPSAAPRSVAPPTTARRPIAAAAPSRAAPARPPTDAGPLPKGERVVLTAIAQHGSEGVTREQLTVLTGYKRSSRDTYLQRLRERGLIQDGERILPTAGGVEALGPGFEPLPTGPELLDHWRRKLPAGELACLEVVVKAYPEGVAREEISEATSYQRSSRDTYLQRLRSRQLITEPARGLVRASDTLFAG
jgi:hypothetical protein